MLIKIGERSAYFGACLAFLLYCGISFAGTVTGELDKAVGSLEDQFVYTLSIQGSMDGDPEFPTVEGLEVQRTGTSQSVSIINGKFSREVQYQYALVPQKAGTFPIPPIRVKLDGEWQETLALELTVNEAGGAGKAGGGGGADGKDAPLPGDQAVFLERSFTKQKVYVGEPIVAAVRIFHRVKFFGAEPEINYPPSFQVKHIDEQRNFSQTINGQEYAVTELNAILTPGKEGNYAIDPAILNAKIGGAPRRRSRSWLDDWMTPTEVVSKRFRSPPGQIEVLPLPLEGRRDDFSGLVGRNIELKPEISQRAVNVGETLTLTLTITSDGATAGMADPDLKLGDKAKIYRDKPQSLDKLDLERGVAGQRIIKYAVVPAKGGTLNLGKLSMQVFDSEAGNYKDLVVDLGEVEVQGGTAAGEKQSLAAESSEVRPEGKAQAKEVEMLGEDLVEPHNKSRLEGSDEPSPLEWTAGGLLSLGGLMFFSSTLWREKREDTRAEREARRSRKQALGRFTQAIKGASNQLAQGQAQAGALQAHSAFKNYFASKFGVNSKSLTLGDAIACLEQRQFSPEIRDRVRKTWLDLDRLLYAPAPPEPESVMALMQNAEQLMQEVDKQC